MRMQNICQSTEQYFNRMLWQAILPQTQGFYRYGLFALLLATRVIITFAKYACACVRVCRTKYMYVRPCISKT
jgi:hypothetical protein